MNKIKRSIVTALTMSALTISSYAATPVEIELEKLSKQIKKLEKKLKKTNKKLNIVKAHDSGDNIKWDVDFRTAMDKIDYTHANGSHSKNTGLLTNRLLLGMKFKADDKTTFYGTLANYTTFGASANHSQSDNNPGYSNFDWLESSNPQGNSIKVKEAYFLYANDSFMGNEDISWTASVGRRPAFDGLGANYREGKKRKSALSHIVNVEVDAASFRWNLDKVIPMEGTWLKLCAGKGLTNAKTRFSSTDTDFASDNDKNPDINMIGFIYVPYDDGQYSVHTQWSRAYHMIGFDSNGSHYRDSEGNFTADGKPNSNAPAFQDNGDLTVATVMLKAEGLGNDINDFLNDTTVFVSYATSETDPRNANMYNGMLGSSKKEKGHSIWIGSQMPCLLTEDGRLGIEWNKGSKYWRSITYAEDTIVGSKIAARGTAIEAYWLKPLTKSLSMSIRHTSIKYDYTGSNGFFGAGGTPMTMAEATAADPSKSPVEKATDTRIAISYKF